MGIFSGCLLVTDVDGSIVDRRGNAIPENAEAFKYFTDEGGFFTIATGRAFDEMNVLYKDLGCNVPLIASNGAIIYDFDKALVLSESFIPREAKEYGKMITETFPDAGFIVISPGHYYVLNRTRGVDVHRNYVHVEHPEYVSPDDIIDQDWVKMLMIAESEARLGEILRFCVSLNAPGVYYIKTCPVYLEMTDITSNKAEGIRRLMPFLPDVRQVFTFGDYDNDIEMLKFGDVSGTVAEANENVRAAADIICGPCESGAAAEFIYRLAESRKEK